MRRIRFASWIAAFCCAFAGCAAGAQTQSAQQVRPAQQKPVQTALPAKPAQTPQPGQTSQEAQAVQQLIPTRTLKFEPVDSDPDFELPYSMVGYPHCLSDGSLVLQTIDWDAVKKVPKGTLPKYKYIVMIIKGKKVQTFSSTGVSDLTDFWVSNIFPADSGIYLLGAGTREQPGDRGPGKSQAGIPWTDYHSYVAKFDLDGQYKGATELGTECSVNRINGCDVEHLAVFPNGDILVIGVDPLTSTLKLLYLKSSGEVMKQIDMPAGRRSMAWGDPSANYDLQQAARTYAALVMFTAVGQNVVVWRANSNDPVLEVTQGGGVREVPLQVPDGYRFVGMIASNDRWVVHFRAENAPANGRMSLATDAYYDVRPQDGSLSARLVEAGDHIPGSIACESSGTYTAFINKSGKMVLLEAGN